MRKWRLITRPPPPPLFLGRNTRRRGGQLRSMSIDFKPREAKRTADSRRRRSLVRSFAPCYPRALLLAAAAFSRLPLTLNRSLTSRSRGFRRRRRRRAEEQEEQEDGAGQLPVRRRPLHPGAIPVRRCFTWSSVTARPPPSSARRTLNTTNPSWVGSALCRMGQRASISHAKRPLGRTFRL